MKWWVVWFCANAGFAQQDLFDLSTTGDGSVAYFATWLGRKGSNDLVQGPGGITRIYQASATGVQLYLERLPVAPEPVTQRGQINFSNYYRLSRPEASRDAKVVAITGARYCIGGDFCVSQSTLQTTVAGLAGGARDVIGGARMSGNGRYLLMYSDGSIGSRSALVDLQTGETKQLDRSLAYGLGHGRVIADDGTAVLAAGWLSILRGTTFTAVTVTGGGPGEAVIDAAGQTIVYSVTDFYTNRASLHVYRIAEGRDSVLVSLPAASARAPFLSADGKRVMFVGGDQIYTVNIDGTGLRRVSSEASGVINAVMSDDGKVAWYFSAAGRLYQMNLETGAAEERMGRTPQIGFPSRLAAGSAYSIAGAGLSDATFAATGYPLPKVLGGVSVLINGVAAPLFSVAPGAIVLQVPWATLDATNVEVTTESSSPFTPQTTFPDTTLTGYGLLLSAFHQDWSGPVTDSAPAHPGEILHLYGTGLGRVDRTPPDGMPAEGDPPAKTIVPVTCWAWGADNLTKQDVAVLFSGLAPGTAAYYQMDVRLPASNVRASTQLACSGEGYNADFFYTVAVAN